MPDRCLLYYVTDRKAFPGDEHSRRRRLLEKIHEAAKAGVDYIQLREKDLPTRDLELLAKEAVTIVQKLRAENRQLRTALLINSRTDVALAARADGVHLRSEDISPQEVREVCGADLPRATVEGTHAGELPSQYPLIAVSCHSPAEVAQAAANKVIFAVFAPVFAKKDAPGIQPTGLALLQQACQTNIPVLALGGITVANARSCLKAGAAGIAAIRLFQENDITEVAEQLRNL